MMMTGQKSLWLLTRRKNLHELILFEAMKLCADNICQPFLSSPVHPALGGFHSHCQPSAFSCQPSSNSTNLSVIWSAFCNKQHCENWFLVQSCLAGICLYSFKFTASPAGCVCMQPHYSPAAFLLVQQSVSRAAWKLLLIGYAEPG